jgi:hypothetical protein
VAASADVTQTTTTDPAIGSLLAVLFHAPPALPPWQLAEAQLEGEAPATAPSPTAKDFDSSYTAAHTATTPTADHTATASSVTCTPWHDNDDDEEDIAESFEHCERANSLSVDLPLKRITVFKPGMKKANKRQVPAHFKNTRELINWYHRFSSKDICLPCDDELCIMIDKELEDLLEPSCHPAWSKSKSAASKCSCLNVFRDPDICMVCANWFVYSFKREKEREDQEMITWYRYANKQRGYNNDLGYLIPCSTDRGQSSINLSEAQYQVLNTHSICGNGVIGVMQRGKDYWNSMKNQTMGRGSIKTHSNAGRKRQRNNDVYQPIADFFNRISVFTEVHATRSVRTMTGTKTQGDDHDVVYLPPSFVIRNCYGRYLDELGYDITTYGDGSYKVDFHGEGEEHPYVTLSTFYNIWKRDFGHIKVSKAVEDICKKCYQFSQCHKFHVGSTTNSTVDGSLFTVDPEEEDDNPDE